MIYEGHNGGSVELLDDLLVIRRKGVLSALNHGSKGEKRIPYRSITSVQFKEPGLTTGYIQFGVTGGSESRGGVFDAVKDENTVLFVKKAAGQFRELRDLVERRSADARRGGSVAASSTVNAAEELTRFADLRDRGVLTEDEFQEEKRRLLGRTSAPPPPVAEPSAPSPSNSADIATARWSASRPVEDEAAKKMSAGKGVGIGCLGLLILLLIIGALGGGEGAGGKETDASNVDAAETSAADSASPKDEYLAQLDRELASLQKIETLDAADIDSKEGVMIQTALLGAWAKVYQDGASHELTPDEESKRKRFRSLVEKQNEQRFPKLRQAQARIIKQVMWENDVDVVSLGARNERLRLTGGVFAANRNIKEGMEALNETARLLRFKRVDFEWYRGADSTYYDLKPLPDRALATLSGAGWTEI